MGSAVKLPRPGVAPAPRGSPTGGGRTVLGCRPLSKALKDRPQMLTPKRPKARGRSSAPGRKMTRRSSAEEREIAELMERIDRKLEELHRDADQVLRSMDAAGIAQPR